MKKIIMVVNNPGSNDYRVLKSAELVVKGGYECHVVGILRPDYKDIEEINGVIYHRKKRRLGLAALFAGYFPESYTRIVNTIAGDRCRYKLEKKVKLDNSIISFFKFFFMLWLAPIFFLVIRVIIMLGRFVLKILRPITSLILIVKRMVRYGLRIMLKVTRLSGLGIGGKILKSSRRILKSSRQLSRISRLMRSGFIKKLGRYQMSHSVIGLRYLQGSYLVTFYSLLCELDGDLYHAHELWVLESCALTTTCLGSRLVYDSHELERHRNLNWEEGPKKSRIHDEEKYIPFVDEVFAVSEGCASVIKSSYNLKNVHLLRNSPILEKLEISHENLRKNLKLDDAIPLLVYTGSVTFNRGLELIVESLKELKEFHFVAVGPYNETTRSELLVKARSAGILDRFHLHDKVRPEVLIDFISSADIAVIPIQNACLSYYYCMPNKLFEASFAGLPIVASRLPDMEKFIKQYEIGETFEPDDVESLVQVIRNVYKSRKQIMTKEKMLKIQKENCFENEINSLLCVYEELVV